ncbi:MAG: hypothetical protein KDK36_02710, partial [Leptospiraceae bacterium]|nr:hypothetical protein [Leptospiraceae bacterium]
FIKKKGLDDYEIGKSILKKSRSDLAYTEYLRGNYIEAAKLYKKDYEEWLKENDDINSFKAFQRSSISIYSHIEESSESKETIREFLKNGINYLREIRRREIKECLPTIALLNDKPNISECDKSFYDKYYDFDVILGYDYFYLAELDYNEGDLESAFYNYGLAYSLLKNPANIPDSEFGLESDKFSYRERARFKIATSVILLRLDDKEQFENSIQDAFYYSDQFNFELESITIQLIRAEYYYKHAKKSSDYESALKLLNEIEETIKKSPGVFYDFNELFLNYLYSLKRDIFIKTKKYHLLSKNNEKLFSAIFFRQLISNEFKFQDYNVFDVLNDIQLLVVEDDEYSDKIEAGLMAGVNINSIIKKKEKNYKKFVTKLTEFSGFLQQGMDILSWTDIYKNKFTLKKNHEMVIELFRSENEYVFISYYKDEKKIFNFTVNDNSDLDEIAKGFEVLLEGKEQIKSLVLIPTAKMYATDFNNIKFKDKTLNEFFKLRYLFRFSQLERESNQEFTRLKRITSLDTRKLTEESFISNIIINPLDLIIRPAVIESEKLKELNLRIVNSTDLKTYLTDTDVLEGPTDFVNKKYYLGEKREGFINIKEVVENQWDIPLLIINNYSRSQDNFLKMGFLYDILQFAGIQSIILIEPTDNKEEIRNKVVSNITNASLIIQQEKITILGEEISPYPNDQKKYSEAFNRFTKEGIKEERKNNYLKAMKKYLLANSVLPENNAELQMEAELNIARIKSYLFNDQNYLQHYENLLSKFNNIPKEEEKILYDLLKLCYEAKENIDCSKYYGKYNSNPFANKDRLFVIDYYRDLKNNNFENIDKNYKEFLNKAKHRDPFLFNVNLADIFTRNFHWDKAKYHLKEADNASSNKEETDIIKDKLSDIEFEKYFILGINPSYTKSDVYSFAFEKSWGEYSKRLELIFKLESNYFKKNYQERIYDAYRKLESSSDFEPLGLGPLYMKNGKPSLQLLKESDRDFLYYILTKSIPFQKGQELNNQFDILFQSELDLNFLNRALWMEIGWANALYYRGDIEGTISYLKDFEDRFEYPDKNLEIVYKTLKYKLSKLTNEVKIDSNEKDGIIKISDKWLPFYEKVDSIEDPDNYPKLINEVLSSLKSDKLDFYNLREFTDITNYMIIESLKKGKLETFLDLSVFRENMMAFNDRTLGSFPSFSQISNLQINLTNNLKAKLPNSQSFKGLIDVGIKTYLVEIENGKISHKIAFEDNRDIKFQILDYLFSIKDEGVNVINQKSIENFYRNAISLKENQLTYLYFPSYHFKVVLEPEEEDNFYFVSNPERLINNYKYNTSRDFLPGFRVNIQNSSPNFDKAWKILKDLERLEYRLNSGQGRGNDFIISEEELKLKDNKILTFGNYNLKNLRYIPKRYGPWAITGSNLGKTSLHNDDFFNSLYFLDEIHRGPGIISTTDQRNTHVALFMRYLLDKNKDSSSLFERYLDAFKKVQLTWREDKYWNGWKPYTNVFIEE